MRAAQLGLVAFKTLAVVAHQSYSEMASVLFLIKDATSVKFEAFSGKMLLSFQPQGSGDLFFFKQVNTFYIEFSVIKQIPTQFPSILHWCVENKHEAFQSPWKSDSLKVMGI